MLAWREHLRVLPADQVVTPEDVDAFIRTFLGLPDSRYQNAPRPDDPRLVDVPEHRQRKYP